MDLSDWKAAFIKLARGVTIDEVALVGASIHPISVDGSINQARDGGFDNWQTAELIARLLRDAVRNGELYVEEAYIPDPEWYGSRTVVPGNKLQTYLRNNRFPAVQGAKFQGGEVWEWMAYHGFIDRKYTPHEPPSRALQILREGTKQSDQIVELKRQLASVQDELASTQDEIAKLTMEKAQPVELHPTAERHAVNREKVLTAAIYAKHKWPDECGDTATDWAETVYNHEATLFEDGKSSLSLQIMTGILSEAMETGRPRKKK